MSDENTTDTTVKPMTSQEVEAIIVEHFDPCLARSICARQNGINVPDNDRLLAEYGELALDTKKCLEGVCGVICPYKPRNFLLA